MSASRGNVQLVKVLTRQLDAIPLSERRRSLSNIDDDVVDSPLKGHDEFPLTMRLLKMQATYGVSDRS
jgi:hypothetical protein